MLIHVHSAVEELLCIQEQNNGSAEVALWLITDSLKKGTHL